MAAILKIYFELLLLNQRPSDSKLGRKYHGDLQIKKSINRSDRYSRMTGAAAILKIFFKLLVLNRNANRLEALFDVSE